MGVFPFFFMFIFAVAGFLYMDYASVEDWGDLGVSLVSTLSIVTVSHTQSSANTYTRTVHPEQTATSDIITNKHQHTVF